MTAPETRDRLVRWLQDECASERGYVRMSVDRLAGKMLAANVTLRAPDDRLRSPEGADALRAALEAYVRAQGRMLDRWAEGDEAVKRELWQALHACEDAGRVALEAAAPEREAGAG